MITLDNVEYNNNLSLSCVALNKVNNPVSFSISYNSIRRANPYFVYKNELYVWQYPRLMWKYTGTEWEEFSLSNNGVNSAVTATYYYIVVANDSVYAFPYDQAYRFCYKFDLDNKIVENLPDMDMTDVLNGSLTNDGITRSNIYMNSYCYDKVNDKIYCETTCTNSNNGNPIYYINEVQITNSTVKLIPICDLSYMNIDTTYDFYQIYPKVVFSYNGELFIAPSPSNNGDGSVLPLYKININSHSTTVVGFMPYVCNTRKKEYTFTIFEHNNEIYCCGSCDGVTSEMAYIYKFNSSDYTWEKAIKYPAKDISHEINKDIDVALHTTNYFNDLGSGYLLFSYNGSIHACYNYQHIVYNEYCQQWLDFGYWICKMKNQT